MVVIPVFLLAFRRPGEPAVIRPVKVPDEAIGRASSESAICELAFKFGQNDFQPLPFRSVSVGDVASLEGRLFIVEVAGFREISRVEFMTLESGRAS